MGSGQNLKGKGALATPAAPGVNRLRRAAARVVAVASVAVLLAGCSGIPHVSISVGTTGEATAPAVAAPSHISTSTAVPPQSATAVPVMSGVSNATTEAIRNVIQKGNQEEIQAVAANDATLMRDTSTTAYYDQLVQIFNDMVNGGVKSIALVDISWGPITRQGTTSAQATTTETWSTTFADGSTLQETDTNVYTLVLEGGAWKVQDDQHPDSRAQQPTTGNSGSPAPVTPSAPADPAGSGQSQSGNWSGYNATGGTFTSVAGSWTVPVVSTNTSGADATWVGIGGVTSRDLIQAGTQAVVQSGRVVYSAWWETLPQASQPVPLNISAGDTMSVSIARQTDGSWLILITDVTTGDSFRKNMKYQSSLSSAEWVEEAPAAGRQTLLPLDNFGTVTFSNATAVENGQQRTIAQTNAQPVTMYNASEQALAQPSILGKDGTSFSVTRTSASSSSLRPRSRFVP